MCITSANNGAQDTTFILDVSFFNGIESVTINSANLEFSIFSTAFPDKMAAEAAAAVVMQEGSSSEGQTRCAACVMERVAMQRKHKTHRCVPGVLAAPPGLLAFVFLLLAAGATGPESLVRSGSARRQTNNRRQAVCGRPWKRL